MFPSKTGFIVSVHRLINIITLLTLIQDCSKGSRQPLSFMRKHTQLIRAIGVSHTACKDEFDEKNYITAGVYFNFFIRYTHAFLFSWYHKVE